MSEQNNPLGAGHVAPLPNASGDIFDVLKDFFQTGTRELGNAAASLLAATPTKTTESTSVLTQSSTKGPTFSSSDQITISQENREKDVIERRKLASK